MVAIIDADGNVKVEYTYDAWGKILSISGPMADTLGAVNPLTYRGYVYDAETDLYYLESRYYDPAVGRFLNADMPTVLTADFGNFAQYNLFAYCVNNPVNMYDLTGMWPSWLTKAIAVVVTAAVVVAATVVTAVTWGPGSVVGVAMITATATWAARTIEVGILQYRKGRAEGKDTEQNIKDTFESIYDNGAKILGWTPVTKLGSIGLKYGLHKVAAKLFYETCTLKEVLTMTTKPAGKVFSYGMAAFAWISTGAAAFSDDPQGWADERGYVLK